MDKAETIKKDLKVCGCGPKQIEAYMQLTANNAQCKFLQEHRNHLLSIIHQKEQQIGCVDYLIYRLKQEDKGGK